MGINVAMLQFSDIISYKVSKGFCTVDFRSVNLIDYKWVYVVVSFVAVRV